MKRIESLLKIAGMKF